MRRVLSAAVLLAILVGTMFWLPWWATAALAGVAAALAGHELAKLGSHQGVRVPAMFAACLAAAAKFDWQRYAAQMAILYQQPFSRERAS